MKKQKPGAVRGHPLLEPRPPDPPGGGGQVRRLRPRDGPDRHGGAPLRGQEARAVQEGRARLHRQPHERDINHIKDNLCLAGRRTQNEKTLHADLILAGITQLITVVLADKIKHHEYIRSLKPLIA